MLVGPTFIAEIWPQKWTDTLLTQWTLVVCIFIAFLTFEIHPGKTGGKSAFWTADCVVSLCEKCWVNCFYQSASYQTWNGKTINPASLKEYQELFGQTDKFEEWSTECTGTIFQSTNRPKEGLFWLDWKQSQQAVGSFGKHKHLN